MTLREQPIEKEHADHKGEKQSGGKPITEAKDNAAHKSQENSTASKAMRFTTGDNVFEIDMGDGKKVSDHRPQRHTADVQARELVEHQHKNSDGSHYSTESSGDQVRIVTYPNGDHVKIDYGADGKPNSVYRSNKDGTSVQYTKSGDGWTKVTTDKDGIQKEEHLDFVHVQVAKEGEPGAGQIDVSWGRGQHHDSLKTTGETTSDGGQNASLKSSESSRDLPPLTPEQHEKYLKAEVAEAAAAMNSNDAASALTTMFARIHNDAEIRLIVERLRQHGLLAIDIDGNKVTYGGFPFIPGQTVYTFGQKS